MTVCGSVFHHSYLDMVNVDGNEVVHVEAMIVHKLAMAENNFSVSIAGFTGAMSKIKPVFFPVFMTMGAVKNHITPYSVMGPYQEWIHQQCVGLSKLDFLATAKIVTPFRHLHVQYNCVVDQQTEESQS